MSALNQSILYAIGAMICTDLPTSSTSRAPMLVLAIRLKIILRVKRRLRAALIYVRFGSKADIPLIPAFTDAITMSALCQSRHSLVQSRGRTQSSDIR